MSTSTNGTLLLAHGSRDPQWRKPFEQVLEQARLLGAGPVGLCFLESMTPDFQSGLDGLVQQGVNHVVVLPLFLAAGGHVRQDLPRLAEEAMRRHPALTIALGTPIGEEPEIQKAIALHIATQTRQTEGLKAELSMDIFKES
jgi:sirohydrochlorin cobaltochelatase